MDDPTGTSVPTDHGGLEVISLEECRLLLAAGEIGRIGFVSAGEPLVMPVNYRVYEGHVVFRTTSGEKLDAARNGASVAFEIDDWDAGTQKGWSVIVGGRAEDVDDPAMIAALNKLGLRPWATAVDRTNWVRIIRQEISGRRII